jgi:hypothetical protein
MIPAPERTPEEMFEKAVREQATQQDPSNTSFHSGSLPTSKSNFGTTTALFNAAGEFQCHSIGSIGGKHDARGKHFCTVP